MNNTVGHQRPAIKLKKRKGSLKTKLKQPSIIRYQMKNIMSTTMAMVATNKHHRRDCRACNLLKVSLGLSIYFVMLMALVSQAEGNIVPDKDDEGSYLSKIKTGDKVVDSVDIEASSRQRDLQDELCDGFGAHDVEYEDGTSGYILACVKGSFSYDIDADREWLKEHIMDVIQEKVNVILPQGAELMANGHISLHGNEIQLQSTFQSSFGRERRLGNPSPGFRGNRSVLVVKVIDASGASIDTNEDQLRNSIFDDALNMATEYFACSYGKLGFVKTADKTLTAGTNDGDETNISNGVTTVRVSVNAIDSTVTTFNNAIAAALNENFGVTLPGNSFGTTNTDLANHIMYCFPPGVPGISTAAAYLDNWLSYYSEGWCTSHSGVMHEIGHNLGLGHANEAADGNDHGPSGEYKDQTGIMGLSYTTEEPRMCFNGAKSFQLGWYEDKVVTLQYSGIKTFIGRLYGVSEYGTAGATEKVIIELNRLATDSSNYYITFNANKGINSGTKDAINKVAVVEQVIDRGAQSQLLAKLDTFGTTSYTIADFDGNAGPDATITVTGIDATAGYADVQICIGSCTCSNDDDCNDGDSCTTNTCNTDTSTCNAATPIVPCCGNGVCESTETIDIVNPENFCSADCTEEIETALCSSCSYLGTGINNGNMFQVKALDNAIAITGFDIHSDATSPFNVNIYTRAGPLVSSYRSDDTGWTLIHSEAGITAQGSGSRTALADLSAGIFTIQPNTVQVFYIASTTDEILSTAGSEVNTVYQSNSDIELYEGYLVQSEWESYYSSNKRFDGTIRYAVVPCTNNDDCNDGDSCTTNTCNTNTGVCEAATSIVPCCGNDVCESSESIAGCPADCAAEELVTEFCLSCTGLGGIMFQVGATNENIVITGFEIFSYASSSFDVNVYTRTGALSSSGWGDPILSQTGITQTSPFSRVPLDDLSQFVTVNAGETQAFFITTTQNLLVTSGTTFNTIYKSDSYLSIYEGYSASASGNPYQFNGAIRYGVIPAPCPPGEERNSAGVCEDPIIKGFRGQIFKFHGRSKAWYSILATNSLQWNDYFFEYPKCSKNRSLEDRMFVTKVAIYLPHLDQKISVDVTTYDKKSPGCPEGKPNCLGDGSIVLSIDGNKYNTPGERALKDGGSVIAHNFDWICAEKQMEHFTEQTDKEFLRNKFKNLRSKNKSVHRRLSEEVEEEEIDPTQDSVRDQDIAVDLMLNKTSTKGVNDSYECRKWLKDRVYAKNLFDQPGKWSIFHIKTSLLSLRLEYLYVEEDGRWGDTCHLRHLNTYVEDISPDLYNDGQWTGVAGETRYEKYTYYGSTIKKNRYQVLSSPFDEDYEVEGPFGTDFLARHITVSYTDDEISI